MILLHCIPFLFQLQKVSSETNDSLTPLPAERIAELLQLCLKSTYFSYNGEFYEQRQGAAMGSPVSAVVANLYTEFFEELALQSAPSRPRFWKWYMDDTCCMMKNDEVEPLLNHLNSARPTIKFTRELERDGSLPFLDTKLTRREGGTLDDCLQEANAHSQVPALQLPPPSKCKEGSRQESLRQGQEHHSTEKEPAGRRSPHHHFQTERLSLTLHPCHILFHIQKPSKLPAEESDEELAR